MAIVKWPTLGSEMRRCLARLEDPDVDGAGVVVLENGVAGSTAPLRRDISAKSWPWRAGYFEVIMACAAAAEHLEDMVVDRTRSMVQPT